MDDNSTIINQECNQTNCESNSQINLANKNLINSTDNLAALNENVSETF